MSDDDSLTSALGAAHARFAAAVEPLRPALHRYCARMTGSVIDGEDLVQETLAQAYYGLSMRRQDVPLRPWLFTIAHHKCVDFLRSRSHRSTVDLDDRNEPIVEIDGEIEDRELAANLFSGLVIALPPRERASVVLKDVLGYSLPEIAKILDTTVGGVKAALHRGRDKLAGWATTPPPPREPVSQLERDYIAMFNSRDWVGLQSLFADDVQCDLVGFVHHEGPEALRSNYLDTYGKLAVPWKLVSAIVDGESVIVCLRELDGKWTPRYAIRLDWRGQRVTRIRDYVHVPYLFADAHVELDR